MRVYYFLCSFLSCSFHFYFVICLNEGLKLLIGGNESHYTSSLMLPGCSCLPFASLSIGLSSDLRAGSSLFLNCIGLFLEVACLVSAHVNIDWMFFFYIRLCVCVFVCMSVCCYCGESEGNEVKLRVLASWLTH